MAQFEESQIHILGSQLDEAKRTVAVQDVVIRSKNAQIEDLTKLVSLYKTLVNLLGRDCNVCG